MSSIDPDSDERTRAVKVMRDAMAEKCHIASGVKAHAEVAYDALIEAGYVVRYEPPHVIGDGHCGPWCRHTREEEAEFWYRPEVIEAVAEVKRRIAQRRAEENNSTGAA